jgi:uncharacterized protein YmfQ (DUF2313 family)
MSDSFKPNTLIENTNCLVAYLPNGRLFAAKNIEGSNLRNLFTAYAKEFGRLHNKIYEVNYEYDLANTTNLIDEWESALQIPDTCLTNVDVSIEQRRKQVVAKFALMNIVTEQDWLNLALFFGFRVRIEYGTTYNVFTMKFPIYLAGSTKAAKFTMIITFLGIEKPRNIFTAQFPITFEKNTNFMMCLFKKLKPANVNLHFRWEP